ncbi:hypothetical protein B9479_008226, partial [Cryptococcus floricola]
MASNRNKYFWEDVTAALQEDLPEDYRSHLTDPEEQMFHKCSQRFQDMFREALNDPSHAENKALYEEKLGRNIIMVESEVETWALISNGKTANHLDAEEERNGLTRMMQSFITNGDVSVPQALITDYKSIKTDEEFEATAETTRAAVEYAIATSRTWGASRASGRRGDAAS